MPDLELIDADGHILEPAGMWRERIEARHRDAAPRVELCNGKEAWFVEDHLLLEARREDNRGLGFSGAAGRTLEEVRDLKYVDNPPGAFDPNERLKVLDGEGMRRAVLYPTTGLFINNGRIRDGALVTACARAYNDWIGEFCHASPERLYGAAAVPLHDVAAAVAELERAVTRLDLRAAFIRPAPYVDDLPFNHEVYDPFWDAAQSLGVPVGLHPAVGDDMPGASRRFGIYGELPSQRRLGMGTAFAQGLGNPIDMIVSMGWFIFGGVCERFPRLKIVVLESGGGWIEPILERMDHQREIFGYDLGHLSLTPTEYFRRQMWVSFDPDERMLAVTAEMLGDDRIVWASDFPHPDAKYPGAGDDVRLHLSGLSDQAQRRIAGQNAAALYSL
ncbi:MAG: amidohydrolase [Chloroflexi bacterium]|nr:amidohydrolase [Chloroflexota bacterium]